MTEPYTPDTQDVKSAWVYGIQQASDPLKAEREFERWYVQEIEKAEYSGYLRAVREGLHR